MQETAISVQFVPGMRFLGFNFGVYGTSIGTTRQFRRHRASTLTESSWSLTCARGWTKLIWTRYCCAALAQDLLYATNARCLHVASTFSGSVVWNVRYSATSSVRCVLRLNLLMLSGLTDHLTRRGHVAGPGGAQACAEAGLEVAAPPRPFFVSTLRVYRKPLA
eukprot:3051752-Rhodomonas_salina.2